MRIIFVTSKLNFKRAGGSVADLDLKAAAMARRGHDVSVLTVYSQKNDIDREVPYRVMREQLSTNRQLPVQFGVCRLLARHEERADVFHVEGQFMLGAGLYRRRGGRVPVVLFFNREHYAWPPEEAPGRAAVFSLKRRCRYLFERLLVRALANRNDHFIFTTPFLRDAYRAFGLSADVPATVMPDFVDEQRLFAASGIDALAAQEARKRPDPPVRLYSTGRMIPEKGFELLLRAMAAFKQTQQVRLTLGGDGPELPRLKKLAADLGVADLIEFPGWVDYRQMTKFLAGADVFILPRWRTELSSVILIEAMAFALPCLVMGGGGLGWLVNNKDLIFSPGDSEDLAKKIDALAANPALRSSLARHCQERFMEAFHLRKLAPQLEAVLRGVAHA